MLVRLYIRNFALIREAELTFTKGLTVLTGETGSGKSMLVDALSTALGVRADTSQVRTDAPEATIEATFLLPLDHPVRTILEDIGIYPEDELVLRRVLETDGRSKAFVNAVRVTQAQMKDVGSELVDIHSQYDNQLLLKPAFHATLLDTYGGLQEVAGEVHENYHKWAQLKRQMAAIQERNAESAAQEALLRSYIDELEALNPQPGDRERLAHERQRLMAGEKLVEVFNDASHLLRSDDVDVVERLGIIERALHTVSGQGGEEVEAVAERFSSLYNELGDLAREMDMMGGAFEPNPERLDEVEEHLFALKDCARKHNVGTEDLPGLLQKFIHELDDMSLLEESMADLEGRIENSYKRFKAACAKLTKGRTKAAENLAGSISEGLSNMKMGGTAFVAELTPLDDPQEYGAEKVEFLISTNKGSSLKPLAKVASGGEVSRLMLALKEVFYQNTTPTTLVFDEVDVGVGGAVADAVGATLQKMADHHQVLAITHLPQVAARGGTHIQITKHLEKDGTITSILPLNDTQRKEEIARMLAGQDVTEAARSAAASLLKA